MRRKSRDFKGLSEWEKTASQQEKDLKATALEYDKLYFDDFNFEPGSITGNAYIPGPISKEYPDIIRAKKYECTPTVIQDFRFHILDRPGIDWGGTCEKWDIYINSSCINRPEVLLHEMIHARIQTFPDAFKEIITVCLYDKLKKDIGRKFKLSFLTGFFNESINDSEFPEFLLHGPLFLLKSFDLDLRLGFSQYTVYGY
jgi:hypothetical protein